MEKIDKKRTVKIDLWEKDQGRNNGSIVGWCTRTQF